jgi:hypothetical protein
MAPEILEADVAAACPPPELIRTIQLDVLDQHVVQCDLQGRPVHPDFERIPLLRTLVGQGERGDEIVEGAGGANGGRRAIVPQVDFEPGTGEVPVKRGVQEDSALAPAITMYSSRSTKFSNSRSVRSQFGWFCGASSRSTPSAAVYARDGPIPTHHASECPSNSGSND